jgi:hypothetical protein
LLAHGRWFSSGNPASSTTNTGRHDIAEILMKAALNTKNQSINQSNSNKAFKNCNYLKKKFEFYNSQLPTGTKETLNRS